MAGSLQTVQTDAVHVGLGQQRTGEARDRDIAEDGMVDMPQGDSLRGGAGDIDERQTLDGFFRSNLGGFDENGGIRQSDIGKTEVPGRRIAEEALDRIVGRIKVAAGRQVDPEKTAPQDLEVVPENVFRDPGAADAGLDIVSRGSHSSYAGNIDTVFF
jgi:hypothetical protein